MADALSDVAAVFGGPSPEHDVSVLTGLQAARALGIRALYWAKTGDWFEVDPGLEAEAFVAGVPRSANRVHLSSDGGFQGEGGRFGKARSLDVGVALLCCHGGPGEDGTLQGALDLAGVAYTGPTVAGAAIGMDKLAFGALMHAAGLPALPRAALDRSTTDVGLEGPYIVKPRFGGSSLGIEVVADLATAAALSGSSPHLRAGAVIEPYRPDLFDVQLAIRTWPELALSAIERPLRRAAKPGSEPEILGYLDKYAGGEGMVSAPRELPAALDPALAASVLEAAATVARLASVRGVARLDFLTDGAELFGNEINTIPGSLARYLWIDPPLAFATLLADLVAEARARPSHAYTVDGADGTVLKGAGAIAAKLA